MRSLTTVLLGLGLLLATPRARADGPTCALDDASCACASDDTCWAWERIVSAPDALLGLRASVSAASSSGSRPVDAALLTTYATERHVTVRELSGHVAASGAIGGGTAGTEGSLVALADFGWRSPSSDTSGAIVRAGVSSLLLGNERLTISVFEPLRVVAGFQVLEAQLLVEGGLSAGFVGAGRFASPASDGDSLARSGEVGSFFTARVGALGFGTSVLYLPAGLTPDGISVGVARAALCWRTQGIALCFDLLYANGTAQDRRGGGARPQVLQTGVAIGLTP